MQRQDFKFIFLFTVALCHLFSPTPFAQEVADDAEADSAKNETRRTQANFTGIPQIDWVNDPNLPRELNGYNMSDYPFYKRVPSPEVQINFSCEGRKSGFYANIVHKCQVYHHCLEEIRSDFLCPNYTMFDQSTYICHFANNVDCEGSANYFDRNIALYRDETTTRRKRPEPKPVTTTPQPQVKVIYVERPRPALRRRPGKNRPRQNNQASNTKNLEPLYYDYYEEQAVNDNKNSINNNDDLYYYYEDSPPVPSTTTTTTRAPIKQRPNRPLRRRVNNQSPRRIAPFLGTSSRQKILPRNNVLDYDYQLNPSQKQPNRKRVKIAKQSQITKNTRPLRRKVKRRRKKTTTTTTTTTAEPEYYDDYYYYYYDEPETTESENTTSPTATTESTLEKVTPKRPTQEERRLALLKAREKARNRLSQRTVNNRQQQNTQEENVAGQRNLQRENVVFQEVKNTDIKLNDNSQGHGLAGRRRQSFTPSRRSSQFNAEKFSPTFDNSKPLQQHDFQDENHATSVRIENEKPISQINPAQLQNHRRRNFATKTKVIRKNPEAEQSRSSIQLTNRRNIFDSVIPESVQSQVTPDPVEIIKSSPKRNQVHSRISFKRIKSVPVEKINPVPVSQSTAPAQDDDYNYTYEYDNEPSENFQDYNLGARNRGGIIRRVESSSLRRQGRS